MRKSEIIAGSHFGIFTKPAGHCRGQTQQALMSAFQGLAISLFIRDAQ